MQLVLAVFLCLLLGLNAFSQSEEINKNSAVGVEEMTLARDDGSGRAGEITDKFVTTDFPIFCFVQLDSEKPTTVKMILIAVKAIGLKPESKIVTVSYTTKDNQNQVYFTASPNRVWAAGDYRADIYIDGRFAKSQTFVIEKSPKEIERPITPTPKSLTPRRRTVKQRKN